MLFEKNPKKLKKILLVVLLFTSILAILLLVFIQEIPGLSSLFNDYITSGESFFIPIIPYINLLEFIPEEHQVVQLSLGHLVDIIIVIGIAMSTERGIYQYYTRICLGEENLIFINVGSYFFEPRENFPSLSQDRVTILRLKDNSLKDLDKLKDFEKTRYKFKSNEKLDHFYNYLRRNDYLIKNRISHRKSKSFFKTCYKILRVSCFHSSFERFLLSPYNHCNRHPKINSLTDSKEFNQQEGCT